MATPSAVLLCLVVGSGCAQAYFSVSHENWLDWIRTGQKNKGSSAAAPQPYTPDYSQEPERRGDFTVNKQQPFNAEPPLHAVTGNFVTPADVFYVRNHAPVPVVNESLHRMVVSDELGSSVAFSVHELREKFAPKSVMATLMCAGNRRNEMAHIKPVRGTLWGPAAISNAVWTGASLRDVLLFVGADVENFDLHVEFEGLDRMEKENFTRGYATSIPMEKAADLDGDVILAYDMNSAPLPPDHGFPVRAVVPGIIGARSVKWLKSIRVLRRESDSHYQLRDYKLFVNHVDWHNVGEWWDRSPAIQDMPVTAAITQPEQNEVIVRGEPYTIRGYALSSGRRIMRVDVSLDGGWSWRVANLTEGHETGRDGRLGHVMTRRFWAWTFWQLQLQSFPGDIHQVICRAWDSASNTMPDNLAAIWNLRGVLNNSWHRVNVSKPIM